MSTQAPPRVSALPILGNALEFAREPIGLLQRGYEQYGDVFAIQLGTKLAAVLIGPEHHTQFFDLTDKNLSMREAYQWLIPMFGELLFASPTHESYLEQRRMMSPILSGRRMAGYVRQMDREITDWIAAQPESGTFELNAFAQFITMFTAARCFMGDEFRQNMGDEFAALYRDIARGIDFLLPPSLPLPKFRARDRAKARLSVLVNDLIAHRRANSEGYDDFIQEMIDARMDNGEPMPPEMITGAIIGFMFAGYETTSAHLTWALIRLLQNPDVVNRLVRPQVDAALAGETEFAAKTLRELEGLNWVLMEIERMEPAATMLMRYAREGFDVGDYHIPAGWLVVISPAIAHRLPYVFNNPDTFDPERYAPDRAEHKAYQHALVGFGGGLHKCWGMSFATNEMAVILARLFQAFDMQLEQPGEPELDRGQQIRRPKSPYRIRFQRRA
jgi:sterol 14-demethylase